MELLDQNGLTEAQAIAEYRKKNYPKPGLTADIVIFRRRDKDTEVLLIRRGGHPFLGKWATPGGFANQNEPIETTAARELQEETGIEGLALHLVDVFSAPGRDPRGWTVSAAYYALIDHDVPVRAGDDAAETRWFTLGREDGALVLTSGGLRLRPADLAFDHAEILTKAIAAAGLSL